MLTFLICLTVYLGVTLFTSLSFLAQASWVCTKDDYVEFNRQCRELIILSGTALSMWLVTAFLMGICWPYVYFVRIKEALK